METPHFQKNVDVILLTRVNIFLFYFFIYTVVLFYFIFFILFFFFSTITPSSQNKTWTISHLKVDDPSSGGHVRQPISGRHSWPANTAVTAVFTIFLHRGDMYIPPANLMIFLIRNFFPVRWPFGHELSSCAIRAKVP